MGHCETPQRPSDHHFFKFFSETQKACCFCRTLQRNYKKQKYVKIMKSQHLPHQFFVYVFSVFWMNCSGGWSISSTNLTNFDTDRFCFVLFCLGLWQKRNAGRYNFPDNLCRKDFCFKAKQIPNFDISHIFRPDCI